VYPIDWKETFYAVSSWASILGFLVSIWVLLYARKVKKELTRFIDFKQWKKKRKQILAEMSGCLKLINEDNILDGALETDILRLITTLQNFPFQFGEKNKRNLNKVFKILSKSDSINRKQLAQELSIICGKLSKEEEFLDG
jgi:hypothetical protein